uniref:Transmembrane protein n=1 Tax=Chromera velia CCMP2878 TaxID=1169474 RepID=A0A0G4HDF1_9ALVE|eukprot:Cvel_26469.t1-p1 / transcript=Cvel_26469.t1 / gene=Cvel_26469 / organism=Chromera_velia_CCMP2878 / gene_product=hypothetical protein / transcript_product=hypothetical protein / location=Cvel_scaffold3150:10070-18282(+) / protein_length=912 / sequence_SO=supercontig / SO=protein_coding / is_pseudo=false
MDVLREPLTETPSLSIRSDAAGAGTAGSGGGGHLQTAVAVAASRGRERAERQKQRQRQRQMILQLHSNPRAGEERAARDAGLRLIRQKVGLSVWVRISVVMTCTLQLLELGVAVAIAAAYWSSHRVWAVAVILLQLAANLVQSGFYLYHREFLLSALSVVGLHVLVEGGRSWRDGSFTKTTDEFQAVQAVVAVLPSVCFYLYVTLRLADDMGTSYLALNIFSAVVCTAYVGFLLLQLEKRFLYRRTLPEVARRLWGFGDEGAGGFGALTPAATYAAATGRTVGAATRTGKGTTRGTPGFPVVVNVEQQPGEVGWGGQADPQWPGAVCSGGPPGVSFKGSAASVVSSSSIPPTGARKTADARGFVYQASGRGTGVDGSGGMPGSFGSSADPRLAKGGWVGAVDAEEREAEGGMESASASVVAGGGEGGEARGENYPSGFFSFSEGGRGAAPEVLSWIPLSVQEEEEAAEGGGVELEGEESRASGGSKQGIFFYVCALIGAVLLDLFIWLYYFFDIHFRILALTLALLHYTFLNCLVVVLAHSLYVYAVFKSFNNHSWLNLLAVVALSLVGPFAVLSLPFLNASLPVCLWILLWRLLESSFYVWPFVSFSLTVFLTGGKEKKEAKKMVKEGAKTAAAEDEKEEGETEKATPQAKTKTAEEAKNARRALLAAQDREEDEMGTVVEMKSSEEETIPESSKSREVEKETRSLVGTEKGRRERSPLSASRRGDLQGEEGVEMERGGGRQTVEGEGLGTEEPSLDRGGTPHHGHSSPPGPASDPLTLRLLPSPESLSSVLSFALSVFPQWGVGGWFLSASGGTGRGGDALMVRVNGGSLAAAAAEVAGASEDFSAEDAGDLSDGSAVTLPHVLESSLPRYILVFWLAAIVCSALKLCVWAAANRSRMAFAKPVVIPHHL